MKRIATWMIGLLSVLVAFGLTIGATSSANASERDLGTATKAARENAFDDVATFDDDDDDDDTRDNDDTDTGVSKPSNDTTNSRITKVSRNKDLSRGDLTRDWTYDGKGGKKRDFSANSTNDKSRNDTRR